MAQQPKAKVKLSHYFRYTLEFLVLMVFNVVLFVLPWFITWRLGRGFGWSAYYLLKKRRGTIEQNVKRAFPDKDQDAQEALIKGCYMHWGESFISTLKLWMISGRKARSLVDAPGLDAYVLQAQKVKDPILYFTGHFGSWEMAGRYVAGIGVGGASIYRIQRNPMVNWFLTWIREYHNLKLISSWSGMRAFEEGMVKYSCLAVVGDQYKRSGGVTVDYFGQPSSTPKGAAVLTYRVKPRLVVLICRQNRGRYRIDIEEIQYALPESMSQDWIKEITQELTTKLETEVRKTPEQYFWFHRRWRDLDRADAKREKARADH
ncbi:MAG: lysophospholipid acyltransferase family protein [Candidatus Marinimicrobia bacterium]|nr:lysophospholipid acyltransferase family protein [Candidatus Neomarinimicrobiota bacterium]MCF7851276.1 lysophospholipid acyltransferase family protein [Candidatus Neomarinimicrobiota bacterium]MCF7904888.1 lysophospholipid acyltransferase family protein [Candidatus Neomarinimicrobiota bacterium]